MNHHIESLLRDGNVAEANRLVEQYISGNAVAPDELYSLCRDYISSKAWNMPERLIERIVSIDRNNIELFRSVASQINSLGYKSESLNILKTCLKSSPADAFLLNELGELYFRAGELKESIRCLEEALHIRPQYREAEENLLRAETKDYLLGFFTGNDYGENYIAMHLERFIETLKVMPEGDPHQKMLELGSYPYLALLYKKHLRYDVTYNCSFNDSQSTHTIKVSNGERDEEYEFAYDNFNVETDLFPYPDNSFDIVVAFELIEHLEHDPMFMLSEANRVLKTGGKIILTTPNVASLRSLHFLISGIAPYYYPKFGVPVGSSRHLREFTPWEMRTMLEAAGMEVELLETKNVWQRNPEGFDYGTVYENCSRMIDHFESQHYGFMTKVPPELRGEDIFAVGGKVSDVVNRYPEMMYEQCG